MPRSALVPFALLLGAFGAGGNVAAFQIIGTSREVS